MKNDNFIIFREKKPFLVGDESNRHLIETKLVHILDDIKLEDRARIFLVEYITEGKLTVLGVKKEEDQETVSPGASGQIPGKGTLLGDRRNEDQETASPEEGLMKRWRRFKTWREGKIQVESQKKSQKGRQEEEDVKPQESSEEVLEEDNEDPTAWTVTPYDLGGHTSYFNSQKLFSSSSSVFFLAFQR